MAGQNELLNFGAAICEKLCVARCGASQCNNNYVETTSIAEYYIQETEVSNTGCVNQFVPECTVSCENSVCVTEVVESDALDSVHDICSHDPIPDDPYSEISKFRRKN